MNDLLIETVGMHDKEEIFSLVKSAFRGEAFSDGKEQDLVKRLFEAGSFRSELALKASIRGDMVGFVLLSEIELKNPNGHWTSLSLAPVAVLPGFQGKGIGSALIKEAHKRADELGYGSVVVIGHKDYYPRFGYRPLDAYGIGIPFEVDKAYCFLRPLAEFDVTCSGSEVIYPKEFFEQ